MSVRRTSAPRSRKPDFSTTRPQATLDVFENPEPGRDYTIRFHCPEFTCLCPLTGQPDFAEFEIEYVPDRLCLELKGLKLYLWSFRDQGAFHEKVTNRIADDIVAAIRPRYLRIVGDFKIRGGIQTWVEVEHHGRGRTGAGKGRGRGTGSRRT